jgi:hypothetical protein
MSFSKLLQLDTETVTPARAAAAFQAEVSRLVREQGLSLADAWAQVKSLEPDLYGRISDAAPASAALANSSPNVPVDKSFYLPMMKMAGATDEEFRAAWLANGAKSSPLNAQNVLTALIGLTASRQNISVATARGQMVEKFPQLAALAGERTAATLGNDARPQEIYYREFEKALPRCGNDPQRAHHAVMALPQVAKAFGR